MEPIQADSLKHSRAPRSGIRCQPIGRSLRKDAQVFGDTVSVHERDSLSFLSELQIPTIDLADLDSLDTTEPGHAEHAFRELQLVVPKLHAKSLIVFDDTPWNAGAFTGKGAKAVPWLIEQSWHILYAGYQVVLSAERE